MLNQLSAIKVKKTTAPGKYADGGGLYLQVSRWRTKSWLFRFERDGRDRWMGLGPVHTISLSEAREHARECRQLVLKGEDPIDSRRGQRSALKLAAAKRRTFADCAEAYVTAHETG